ncbi:unnamed protein product [Cylicostephanus goldi]|uniref:Uncharacterized protein n=1 Tax=Cylicostephanus goldi TaxID=71465 RepID=A0A3P6RU95_CYLGO|nr:unnamed protein product [Cylicostephanus goldi]
MAFGTHAQRAAIISAGVGLSLVIFIFLSVFFEFDWYHHEKGVDIGFLFGLLLFLFIGMSIHWMVVRGIKLMQPRYLVPFILIYTMVLVFETIFFIFVVNHIVILSSLKSIPPQSSSGYILVTIMFMFAMGIQSIMLTSVNRCRNYLEKRQIHELEMRVAEKSKLQHPGIRIVFGAGDSNISNGAPASNQTNATDPPPPYENATQQNGTEQPPAAQTTQPPQRTVLQAEDGIL